MWYCSGLGKQLRGSGIVGAADGRSSFADRNSAYCSTDWCAGFAHTSVKLKL